MKKLISKTILVGILCVPFLACGNEEASNFKNNDQIEQKEETQIPVSSQSTEDTNSLDVQNKENAKADEGENVLSE